MTGIEPGSYRIASDWIVSCPTTIATAQEGTFA